MACAQTAPAVVSFDECAPAYKVGKIKAVYFRKADAEALLAIADLVPLVDNEGVVGTEVRKLTVEGDKPAPSRTPIARFNGKIQQTKAPYVLNISIEDVSDQNYAFMVNEQQVNGTYQMWYEDENGDIFGGLTGIKASFALEYVIPRSNTEGAFIQGTVNWESKTDPVKEASPFVA